MSRLILRSANKFSDIYKYNLNKNTNFYNMFNFIKNKRF